MSQKKPNKAVERTKGWIFEAFMKLLAEKSWAEIGISDITEKAGVARSSFYRHYASKEDIVIQRVDTILFDDLMNKLKAYGQERGGKKKSKPLTVYFETLMKYRDLIALLLKSDIMHLLDSFIDKLEALILDAYKKSLPPGENLRFQYAVKFQVGGLSHIARHWVKNKMSLSPSEMSDLAEEFLNPFKRQKRCIVDALLLVKEEGAGAGSC
jgi:AcrR family transcriptional regulator